MNSRIRPTESPAPPATAGHAQRRWERWLPAFVLVTLPMVALGVRRAVEWHWPLPFCWLRALTGVPCPACGCTRSLAAWAQGDLLAAFRFNPLFFVACLGLVGWAIVRTLEEATGAVWLDRWPAGIPRVRWRRAVLLLAALNWLYLCLLLPK